MKEKRISESNEIIHRVFLQTLDAIKLHTLPRRSVDKYEFVTKPDWSSDHCNQKYRIDEFGETTIKVHFFILSWRIELYCVDVSLLKEFRGSAMLVIRTDIRLLFIKAMSGNSHDDDIRAFRRWRLLLTYDPGFEMDLTPRSEIFLQICLSVRFRHQFRMVHKKIL